MSTADLSGTTVVNTLTSSGGDELDDLLREAGVEVERNALISKSACWRESAVEGAVEGIAEGAYHWVVFTSQTAVREFADALNELGLKVRWNAVSVASVGESTTGLIEELLGCEVALTGPGGGAELAEALNRELEDGTSVLFPCARQTSGGLEDRLESKLAEIHPLVLYRTRTVAPPRKLLERADWMVVGSPSGARALSGSELPEGLRFAAIGPTTGAALAKLSDNVVVADKPTPGALFKVIADG